MFQSATQHLELLEAANLISTVRHGREKLHYLNPVPLHDMQQRWIEKFERRRLTTLTAIKQRAEAAMTERPSFRYVTYIESTPEQVWQALTDADLTADYWGHANVSDWQVGSSWTHERTDGSRTADVVGTVLIADRPTRLVMTWADPHDTDSIDEPTTVTFEIEPYEQIVRLTVTHEHLADEANLEDAAHGWAAVIANLKSLLETGHVLSQRPWEMP